jgi:hypothetical protein
MSNLAYKTIGNEIGLGITGDGRIVIRIDGHDQLYEVNEKRFQEAVKFVFDWKDEQLNQRIEIRKLVAEITRLQGIIVNRLDDHYQMEKE